MQDSTQATNWFDQRLADGGPMYTETNLDHFIAEPWNMVSSLLVIIPSVYFLIKIRKRYQSFGFLFYGLILVMLASVGSALFHGLRTSMFFLILDIVPIVIFMISLGIYFWVKVLKKWWYVLLIFIPTFALRGLLFRYIPNHLAINISYAMSGLLVIIPLIWFLNKNNWRHGSYIIYSTILFAIALFFRQYDAHEPPLLPIGTHFLWHVFSAVGTFFILYYLYKYRSQELKENQEIEENHSHQVL